MMLGLNFSGVEHPSNRVTHHRPEVLVKGCHEQTWQGGRYCENELPCAPRTSEAVWYLVAFSEYKATQTLPQRLTGLWVFLF